MMNFYKKNLNLKVIYLLFCVFSLSGFTYSQNLQPIASTSEKPFEFLVIGDSVVWGQGLKSEEKFSHLVKDWLEKKFDGKRSVNMFAKAHSGAAIEKKNEGKLNPETYFHGEINLWTPSIKQQAKDAFDCYRQPTDKNDCYQNGGMSAENLSFYQGKPILPANVNLILVDGCANDINAIQIFNFFYKKGKLRNAAKKHCQDSMSDLLKSLVKYFPNAKIVVTGYYPLVTRETDPNILYKALLNAFGKSPVSNKTLKFLNILDWKEIDKIHFLRNELAQRSSIWHTSSTENLKIAVALTNKLLQEKQPGFEERIFFVDSEFKSDNAFAAPNTYLWKLIDQTRTDDSMFEERQEICNDPRLTHYKWRQHFICQRAGLFHPNREGAKSYFRAIVGALNNISF